MSDQSSLLEVSPLEEPREGREGTLMMDGGTSNSLGAEVRLSDFVK